MTMNLLFLSTSGTFDIKGSEGAPRGGEKRLLIVIFYLYKADILVYIISPYVGNIVWAKFTASIQLAVNIGLYLL